MSRAAPAGLVAALALVACTTASAADAPPAAPTPGRPSSLVVAVSLGDPSLQAGVLRGREVILARGFEIELARALARGLGSRVGGFLHVRPTERLLAGQAAPWHFALASIEAGRNKGAVDLSAPYLTTDLAVVLRRGLARPRRLAELHAAIVCVARADGALPVVMRAIRPARRPLVATGRERLRELVRTGACDAAVIPAREAGRFVAATRPLVGPIVGRIRHGEGLVVAVPRGSGVAVGDVNRQLARLRADGTLGRLARTWLRLDPARLPRLR